MNFAYWSSCVLTDSSTRAWIVTDFGCLGGASALRCCPGVKPEVKGDVKLWGEANFYCCCLVRSVLRLKSPVGQLPKIPSDCHHRPAVN